MNMSLKLSFDPMVYDRPLEKYGKALLQVLLRTWVTEEEENIGIVNNHYMSRKQPSLEQIYLEQSTSPAKKKIIFSSANRDNLKIQDYYKNNFECEENFDSEIIPRISLSPMDYSTNYKFLKPFPKIKQMIEISCENETMSRDRTPLQIEEDSDKIILATIIDDRSFKRHCKLANFKCRYKSPQNGNNTIDLRSNNNTKPKCYSEMNMPIKENISIKTIYEILTHVNSDKDITNNNRNLAIRSEHGDITWDNMIDPEVFGLSLEVPIDDNDANEEKPMVTVHAGTDEIVQNKDKTVSICDTDSPQTTTLFEDEKNKTCAEEVNVLFDKGTKRKYNKQEKISNILNKKVKNTTKQIGPAKNEKSLAITNDWLEKHTDEFNLETNHGTSNEKSINEKKSADLRSDLKPTTDKVSVVNKKLTPNSMDNMKQTRLVNKGGVMKFSKKDIKSQNKVIKIPPVIHNKSDNIENMRQKSKFITPFKSQIPMRDVIYEIVEILNTDAISTFKSIILSRETVIIAMTIIYREGFCQLNKNFNGDSCSPEGLMICCNKSAFYYIPIMNKNIKYTNELRQFIASLMLTSIRKICFEAQDLIMLFADLFKIEHKEITLKWMLEDTKISCFLLDPDKPPGSFPELQLQIGLCPDFTIYSACVKQKTAWCLTFLVDCADKINTKLEDSSLTKIFEIETKLIAIVSVMELRGFNVNVETLKQIGGTIENKMKSVEMLAYQCADKVFQINSPVQLRTILYDDLKLDQKCNIKVRETICLGAKSTSEPTLKLLAASHPLPRLILEYRHLHKALATFVNGMLQHAKNGVIRATWEQTAVATGRISCSNPNLQTIPKNPFVLTLFPTPGSKEIETPIYLRSAYTARDGFMLVAADFQHIESRIFAHLSGDEGLMEVFRQNKDFFLTLAGKWLNKVEKAVTSVERDRTKRMVYASMYGAGTKKLMEILGTDYEQTLAMMNSFSRVFPSLKAFGQKVVKKCLSEGGVLQSICGRRRMFPNIFTQNAALRAQAERQAVNFVIQGSAADLCKIAMIITEENLSKTVHNIQCGLILQIHDELVWEVAEEHVSLAKDVIKSAMESCGQVCGLSIPLPVLVTSGKNWAEMI